MNKGRTMRPLNADSRPNQLAILGRVLAPLLGPRVKRVRYVVLRRLQYSHCGEGVCAGKRIPLRRVEQGIRAVLPACETTIAYQRWCVLQGDRMRSETTASPPNS